MCLRPKDTQDSPLIRQGGYPWPSTLEVYKLKTCLHSGLAALLLAGLKYIILWVILNMMLCDTILVLCVIICAEPSLTGDCTELWKGWYWRRKNNFPFTYEFERSAPVFFLMNLLNHSSNIEPHMCIHFKIWRCLAIHMMNTYTSKLYTTEL